MTYKDKTKEQRINESAELQQRIEDLEAEAAKRTKAAFVDNVFPADHKRSLFIWDNKE